MTTLRVAIAGALLYYLVISGALKWSAILELVKAWQSTGAALVLLATALVLTAWRLCVLLRPAGFHLSLVASVRLTLIGTFFNTCMLGSGGGDVVRIYYATLGNVGRRTEVVTVMLLDRVAGLFALMLWPLLVILPLRTPLTSNPVVAGLLASAAAIALAIAALLTIALSGNFKDSRLVKGTLEILPGGGYLRRALETVHSYKAGRVALAKAVGISLIAHTVAMLAT
ncbi:MAG: hypothetical protein GTN88_12420, partial [Gammaproteobacteria bacterium]|nr:hypothetical protein [Gammaproteobacteria bacterium]